MASSGSSGHLVCEGCGSTDFSQNQEGFYVCNDCLTQSQEYVEQHLDYTDTTGHKGRAIRKPKAAPEQEPLENLEACYPGSKGTFLDYFQELLLRQVEALVSDCGVNPMITDLVRKLWFRYLVIRDNRIANNDSFHLRLRIWKENQAETPTKNAKNKTKSGQNVEEAKTWLEEMGLSSMLQKQEEEEEEEEDEEEEEGEEEKRGKKRERKTKKKKPWEPRKRRDAMSSKRKVVVELECSVDLPQLSLTIALNYVGCNIVQEPLL